MFYVEKITKYLCQLHYNKFFVFSYQVYCHLQKVFVLFWYICKNALSLKRLLGVKEDRKRIQTLEDDALLFSKTGITAMCHWMNAMAFRCQKRLGNILFPEVSRGTQPCNHLDFKTPDLQNYKILNLYYFKKREREIPCKKLWEV